MRLASTLAWSLIALSGLAACALLLRPAQACGGFFHKPGELAEQRTFEAIFTPGPGQVQVDYKVIYAGAAADFGWVLPIPGAFLDLQDSQADFDGLRAETKADEDLKEIRHTGCGGADKSGGLGDTGTTGVDVVAQGFTGTYAYMVLEATDTTALTDWLTGHGWELGTSVDGLQAYIDDGGYQFVAVALQSDHEATSDDEAFELPGIAISYEGARVEWPARMARYGMQGLTHTVLYVRGQQRARITAGWTEVELPSVWDQGEEPDYMRYSAWPETLASIGQDQGFATVFAGPVDPSVIGIDSDAGWVTRFETLSMPEVHTADVVFGLDGGTDEMRTVISNRGGCNRPAGALFFLLPGVGLVALRRRRSA